MPTRPTSAQPIFTNAPQPRAKKPLIFISHHTDDPKLAELFDELLRKASLGTLDRFRSSDKKGRSGILFGKEWYEEVMAKLSDAEVLVALLTPRSFERPWILFEVGVAKGKNAPAFGVVFDMPLAKASTGPFAQLQNCASDEESLVKLLDELIRLAPGTDPDKGVLRQFASEFLEDVSRLEEHSPESQEPPTESDRVASMLEELRVLVREMPKEIADRIAAKEDTPAPLDPDFLRALSNARGDPDRDMRELVEQRIAARKDTSRRP